MVSNLLTVVGGAPHFRRPNFPQPPKFYPPAVDFSLERFSVGALRRFVEFERRQDAPGVQMLGIAPNDLPYAHVGELYKAIEEGFLAIDEAELFVGPGDRQEQGIWGPNVSPTPVKDRASAVAAIRLITEVGEGTSDQGVKSHYQRFIAIADQLKAETQADPAFSPARNVAANPMTRRHRDAREGPIHVIDVPDTRDVAELFNNLYTTMVLGFQQFYAFAGESEAQREALRSSFLVLMMKEVLAPLGKLLTQLPLGTAAPNQTAGPSFELYGNFRLSATPKVAWGILIERLVIALDECRRLEPLQPAALQGVMHAVGNNVAAMRDSLQAVLPT